jgi:hypothetical protein
MTRKKIGQFKLEALINLMFPLLVVIVALAITALLILRG